MSFGPGRSHDKPLISSGSRNGSATNRMRRLEQPELTVGSCDLLQAAPFFKLLLTYMQHHTLAGAPGRGAEQLAREPSGAGIGQSRREMKKK